MKYLPLVWAGLWRKRARTVLTLCCIVVAFGLFGILHGFTAAIDGIIDAMSDTRLRSMSRVNIMEALPLAHAQRMATVPGVQAVSYYNFFAGYYQETRNSVQVGAIDVESFNVVYPDIQLEPQYIEAMKQTRNGALVGEDLAKERGWKVGDRIPLGSAVWRRKDGAESWDFEIVGSYRSPSGRVPTNELWINYAYFDEARADGNGTVTIYFLKIADPNRAAEISEEVDKLFANSMFETQTQSEKDWLRAQIGQIGDIGFFVNAIIAAVMFALLFVTGNTMMQSVRERIPELVVLKTYGFSNLGIVSLVIAESLLLCSVAAALGIGIAAAISPSLYREFGAGGLNLPLSVIGMGLGLAAVFAVVSALLPALRAQRLSIVDALAGR
ncbi:MAG TPA: ABC transporter permease [Gammaproteobacteria bacterium]|nr:ABC transporter permease [Gammaproteobacteria bacterium]